MTRPPRLRAEGVRLAYGDSVVVDGLDLDIVDGTVTAVIGPNGCGKSTLLRALGRLLRPKAGQVVLDGRRIDTMPTREVAGTLALLPQAPLAPEGLVVRDLVARGRHPRQSWLRQWSRDDEDVVDQTLRWTSMTELAARYSDRMVAMCDGQVVAEGSPREVLTPPLLRTTFRLDARVIDDPVTSRPLVVPVGSLTDQVTAARPQPEEGGLLCPDPIR